MKLVTWRKQQGLTQEALAEKIGTTRISVIRYEAGRVPEKTVLERIIEVTNGQVTPNDWFQSAAA